MMPSGGEENRVSIVETMLSQKSRLVLVVGGYKMGFHRVLDDGKTKRWKCCKKTCRSFIKTDLEGKEFFLRISNLNHNHPKESEWALTRQKLRSRIKILGMEMSTSEAAKIIREELRVGYPGTSVHELSQWDIGCLKKVVYRARASKAKHDRKHEEGLASLYSYNERDESLDEPILIEDDDILEPKVELEEEPVAESAFGVHGVFAEAVQIPSSPSPPPVESELRILRVKSEFGGIKMEDDIQETYIGPSSASPPSSPILAVKQEVLQDVGYPTDKGTQTDQDPDLTFLVGLLPSMKKLKAGDKSMMKAQIQQLFMWKLNKK